MAAGPWTVRLAPGVGVDDATELEAASSDAMDSRLACCASSIFFMKEVWLTALKAE